MLLPVLSLSYSMACSCIDRRTGNGTWQHGRTCLWSRLIILHAHDGAEQLASASSFPSRFRMTMAIPYPPRIHFLYL